MKQLHQFARGVNPIKEINCNSEIYWDFAIWSECGPINEVDINNGSYILV